MANEKIIFLYFISFLTVIDGTIFLNCKSSKYINLYIQIKIAVPFHLLLHFFLHLLNIRKKLVQGSIVCIFGKFVFTREFIIVENIRLVCLLDLTADFCVKATPNIQLREKTGIQSCLYTVTLTPAFA